MIDLATTAEILLKGGVAVIPTDTIYGLVACAYNKAAVEKIYRIKNRDLKKKCIVLVADYRQAKELGVTDDWLQKAKKYWPGPYSLVLPTIRQDIEQLERSTGCFGFRMPDDKDLIGLIKLTGPLIAPSANPEGLEPAKIINQAKVYFGSQVNLYIDGGTLDNPPSTIIDMLNGQTVR
jgi:L-threonylcarbamoyladenylate synthase